MIRKVVFIEPKFPNRHVFYCERAADKGVVDWQHNLEQKWAMLRFGEAKVETHDEQHFFEIQVYLNDLDPKAVRVEFYTDGIGG
jgi:glycogen phosphorylase